MAGDVIAAGGGGGLRDVVLVLQQFVGHLAHAFDSHGSSKPLEQGLPSKSPS